MRRALSSLPFLATVILVITVLLISALRSRESQRLLEAFETANQPYEFVVQMQFEPEAFHLAKLQDAGRIVGVDGRTVHVRAVGPDQLKRLSRQPWVEWLEPVQHTGEQ